ncbi:flagellar hook-basal body protein [Microaerobacter geothermalis]|uniref:flagellar hook-basal body protein n=1 Tax=Microaerobacter geothermalis TaxID=674972 RepID=UPI001F36FC74|nr:flagellar hook-basal body protein [Microaerobacter geothermalis]MCF6093250.1 flagellar hook-basal body protein [Microaerobacter geothermalis]
MIRGLYTAASGMIALQRRQEVLTNNIANVNTPGFKADNSVMRSFPEMLIQRIRDNQTVPLSNRTLTVGQAALLGRMNTGVYLQETIPQFTQGDLLNTGNELDFAIYDDALPVDPDTGVKPKVFFAVQDREGNIRYTRNGRFTIDGAGQLVTSEGNLVLDELNQPILIGDQPFKVGDDGLVTINPDGDNPQVPVMLNLVMVNNPYSLVKEGNGLYRWEGQQALQPLAQGQLPVQIKQGFIEGSNVDATKSMAEMIETVRAFEANQKVIQAYDRSLEKAVNEIGRV